MPRRKRKAANGDGTVYQCRDGRWAAAFWVSTSAGQRRRRYYFDSNRKACIEWLAEMRLRATRGQIASGDDITLIEWLRVWLDRYTPNIRGSTRTSYQGYAENHISANKLSSLPLTEVTTDELQRYAISLGKSGQPDGDGLSAKTIRNLFAMLHAALDQAVGNGLITLNPCDFVQLPRVEKAEIEVLTEEEISRLLAASRGERWGIAIPLLLFSGFRLGELLALRHNSLQCEGDVWYLRVEHSLNRVTNFDAKPGEPKTVLRLGEPKSNTSLRNVPLLPQVYTALQEHISQQRREAAASWGLYEVDPFIVSNVVGGFIDPTTFRGWFNDMCEKAGITRHIRVHDCRHTAATLMLKSGASPHEVSLILGHSSSQVTERFYLHPDIGVRAEAIQNLTSTAEKLLLK